MPNEELPVVSVIVPSYNSSGTIRRCLESLMSQSTSLKFEVMVVDSSTDNTPEIVREFSPDVTLIRSESRLPPGPARNLGIQRVRAQIVAFTDADCIVNKDWIDNICEAHKLHDAVGGKIMNGTPRNPFGTALYFTEFAEFGTNENRIVASVPTCNMSYKKKVFEKYGVFPDVFWGEEYVLNTKIEEQILFSSNIVVKHMNRTNFTATVRHSYKVGNGCALSRIVANRQGYLFRYKLLIPLTWLYRFIKIGSKSIQAGNFLGFIFVMPFIVIDLFAWTLGFLKGAFEYSSLRESASDSAS